MAILNMSDTPDARSAPLRGGDRWRAVSAAGQGQLVEILSVSDLHVYFRASGRGADGSQKFKLLHGAFRIRYTPLKLANERRRQVAPAAQCGEAPAPVVMPEPVSSTDDPISTAVEMVATEQRIELPAPASLEPSPWEALRPKHNRGGRPPKLSAEQIREIYQLYHSGSKPKEISQTYGISGPTVVNIGKGKDFPWATTDLRAALAQPEQPKEEELAVQIATPPTEPAPMVQTVREQQAPPTASLVSEMADALEVLVDYAGRPLPRFLKVDLDAIRALVDQARAAS
jgi:hypothetical protein